MRFHTLHYYFKKQIKSCRKRVQKTIGRFLLGSGNYFKNGAVFETNNILFNKNGDNHPPFNCGERESQQDSGDETTISTESLAL